jgi:hypothetical protein
MAFDQFATHIAVTAPQAFDNCRVLVVGPTTAAVALKIDAAKKPDQRIDPFERVQHASVFGQDDDGDMKRLVGLSHRGPVGRRTEIAVVLPNRDSLADLGVSTTFAG